MQRYFDDEELAAIHGDAVLLVESGLEDGVSNAGCLSATHLSVPIRSIPTTLTLKAIRKVPKFLLLSRAPASCGFMAEPVGTRQGSPLSLR